MSEHETNVDARKRGLDPSELVEHATRRRRVTTETPIPTERNVGGIHHDVAVAASSCVERVSSCVEEVSSCVEEMSETEALGQRLLQAWPSIQQVISQALLGQQGLHSDELENYDSYLKFVEDLILQHLKASFVDDQGQLHELKATGVSLVRPYAKGLGPQQFGLVPLTGSYTAQVRVNLEHRILLEPSTRPTAPEEVKLPQNVPLTVPEDAEPDENDQAFDDDDDDLEVEENDEENADDVEEEEEDDPEEAEEGDEAEEGEEEEAKDTFDEGDEEAWEALLAQHVPEVEMDVEAAESEAEAEALAQPIFSVTQRPYTTCTKHSAESSSFGMSQSTLLAHLSMGTDFNFSQDSFSQFTQEISCQRYNNVYLGELPVWIGTELCVLRGQLAAPQDYYYTLSEGAVYLMGTPKVMPYQRQMALNQLLTQYNPTTAEVTTEVRSELYEPSKRFRTNVTLKMTLSFKKYQDQDTGTHQRWRFLMQFPHEKLEVSLACLGMALGWKPTVLASVARTFLPYDLQGETWMRLLLLMEKDTHGCRTQVEALMFIGKHMKKCRDFHGRADDIRSYVCFMVRTEVFPELNSMAVQLVDPVTQRPTRVQAPMHTDDNLRKGYRLAQVIADLILYHPRVQGDQPPALRAKYPLPDLASDAYRRYDTPGHELMVLLRKFLTGDLLQEARDEFKRRIRRGVPIDAPGLFKDSSFALVACVRHGTWDPERSKEAYKNRTHSMILDCNSLSYSGYTQKITDKSKGHSVQNRLPHPSEARRIDLTATPEGKKCLETRFKAATAVFTPWTDRFQHNERLLNVLENEATELSWIPLGHQPRQAVGPDEFAVLGVFGGLMGWTRNPRALWDRIVMARRRGEFYRYLGVRVDLERRVLAINADPGRLVSPLLVWSALPRLELLLQTGLLALDTNPLATLIEHGLLEYLDSAEETSPWTWVWDSPDRWTDWHPGDLQPSHLDPYPQGQYTVASCAPHTDRGMQHRTSYNRNMVSSTTTCRPIREPFGMKHLTTLYGQTPLQNDRTHEVLQTYDYEPAGVHLMTAVMAMPHVYEDNVVLSRRAVDLGFGIRKEYKTFRVVRRSGEYFGLPPLNCLERKKQQSYAHLGPHGLPTVGQILKAGQVVVGRFHVDNHKKVRDTSRSLSTHPSVEDVAYRVEHVKLYETEMVDVVVSNMHSLQLGDKLYWGVAQKGTLGAILEPQDMPFSHTTGHIDLVVSPFACGRQTCGVWKSMMCALAQSVRPELSSRMVTNFATRWVKRMEQEAVRETLRELGMDGACRTTLCRGDTGEQIKDPVFVGLAYVRVSRHEAAGKSRSRNREGPIEMDTRQPKSGREIHGGLKVSELVTNSTHSMGTAFLMQHLLGTSDPFQDLYCVQCQQVIQDGKCPMCFSTDHLARVDTVFISKLLQEELRAAGLDHDYEVELEDPQDPDSAFDPEYIQAQMKRLQVT